MDADNMKAIVYTEYGTTDVLKLKDVDKPIPRDDEVLVKIYAVSLNASDWEFVTGSPLYARIYGFLKPKNHILGSDIAGQVEAVGKKVSQFRPGDSVFGDIFDCFGGFAEFVCAPEKMLMRKPDSLTFEQAAALPQAACIALQGIRNKGKLQSGENTQGKSVLINGAGGGAGLFALQIAKSFGAIVTGVDNAEKLETMRSMGADHVIDYKQEDFTKNGQRYDLILDLAAHHSVFDYARALKPTGRYLMVGGSMGAMFQLLFLGWLISLATGKRLGILALKPNKDLADIVKLIEAGDVHTVIDRRYSLSEVPDALQYLGDGHAKGKIIINLQSIAT